MSLLTLSFILNQKYFIPVIFHFFPNKNLLCLNKLCTNHLSQCNIFLFLQAISTLIPVIIMLNSFYRSSGCLPPRPLPPDPQHCRVPDNDRRDGAPDGVHGGIRPVSGAAPVQTAQLPAGHTEGRVHHLAQKGEERERERERESH